MSQIPLLTDQGFGRPSVASGEMPLPSARSSIGAALGYGLMDLGETGMRIAQQYKESQVRTQVGMANVEAIKGLEELTFQVENEPTDKMVEKFQAGAAKLKESLLKSASDSTARQQIAQNFDEMSAIRTVNVRRDQFKRQVSQEKAAFELQVQALSRVATTATSPVEREAAAKGLADLYAASSGRLFDSPEDAELARRQVMADIQVAQYNQTIAVDPHAAAKLPLDYLPVDAASKLRATAEAEARAQDGDKTMATALNYADASVSNALALRGEALDIANKDITAIFKDVPFDSEVKRQNVIRAYQQQIQTDYVTAAFLDGPLEAREALAETSLPPESRLAWEEKIRQLEYIQSGRVDKSIRDAQEDTYEGVKFAALRGYGFDNKPVTMDMIDKMVIQGKLGVDHGNQLWFLLRNANSRETQDEALGDAVGRMIQRNGGQ